MSAIDSRAKLIQAGKKLMTDWDRTREVWRDSNARQFDKRFMGPLEAHIRAAALGIERIGTALSSAVHDCQDSTGHRS